MTEHAHPQSEELKKHGDELENALKPRGAQKSTVSTNQPATSRKSSNGKE